MTDRRNMDFIDGYDLQSTTHPRRLLAPSTHEDARFDEIGFEGKVSIDVKPRPVVEVIQEAKIDFGPLLEML